MAMMYQMTHLTLRLHFFFSATDSKRTNAIDDTRPKIMLPTKDHFFPIRTFNQYFDLIINNNFIHPISNKQYLCYHMLHGETDRESELATRTHCAVLVHACGVSVEYCRA